ncbi:armadillo-type protein [Mycena rosella]|uniref:Armadillo-type protein n=1 Tax=Mycena rosella TaxID=1033263 RepID=A0AAD7D9I1_MYCRO|nr:armadillo-type protein [Mycena rosella]
MPQSQRPQSIHSWWSDSNKPIGATIPLHPIASQLAKLLYHRQVIHIIRRHASHPLSASDLDAFLPYLLFNQIRNTTKIVILKEIEATAKSKVGIRAIAETELPAVLVELLQADDPELLESTCSLWRLISSGLVKNPAVYTWIPPVVYTALGPSPHKTVRVAATCTLQHLVCTRNAEDRFNQALDIQIVLPPLVDLLNSTPDETSEGASILLDNICSPLDKRVVDAILPYLESQHVSAQAKVAMLSTLGRFQFNLQLLAQTSLMSVLARLLQSSDEKVLLRTCLILCHIVSYKSWLSTEAVLDAKLVPALSSVFRCSDSEVVRTVVEIFSDISSPYEAGARSIVEADALPRLVELLRSPDPRILHLTCTTLRNITSHNSLTSAVFYAYPVRRLVSIISRPLRRETISAALLILSAIDHERTDHVGLAFSHALRSEVPTLVGLLLLQSSNPAATSWAASALNDITRHGPLRVSLASSDAALALPAVLSPPDPPVQDTAVNTLFTNANISWFRWPAIHNTYKTVVPPLLKLLYSTDHTILRWACSVLGDLAHYHDAADETLDDIEITAHSCGAIAALLSHSETSLISSAVHMLAQISDWPRVAASVVASGVAVPILVTLLSFAEAGTLRAACTSLGHLAPCLDSGSTAYALLLLASLLSDADPPVRSAAASALIKIICSPQPSVFARWTGQPRISGPPGRRVGSLAWLGGLLADIVNRHCNLIDITREECVSRRCGVDVQVDNPQDTAEADIDLLPLLVGLVESGKKPQIRLACVVLAHMYLEIVLQS